MVQKRIHKAAAKIQSTFRGWYLRRTLADKRVEKALKRIHCAEENATEEMKLCNRTQTAIDYLLSVKNLSTVYDKLCELDVATRLSFECCESVIQDNAHSVIYKIVRFCNRSLPHMEIKRVAFCILSNLAKCSKSYKYVLADPESLPLILDQMQMFRDKKAEIFSLCSNLLSVLCNDESIKKSVLKDKKVVQKLSSLHSLSRRKSMTVTKRQNETARRSSLQNFNRRASGSVFVIPAPPPPRPTATAWHRRVNSIDAKDPVVAIINLCKQLELV